MSPEEEAIALTEYDQEFIDDLLFGSKLCPACGCKRPACTTYWARDVHKPDGFKATCRSCVAARAREHYANDPELRDRKNKKARVRYRADQAKRKPPARVVVMVPTGPSNHHLLALLRAGMNTSEIARASGLHRRTVREVIQADRRQITASTEAKLLAVAVPEAVTA